MASSNRTSRIPLSARRLLPSDRPLGSAIRAELATLPSSGNAEVMRDLMTEIQGISARLQRIASSLRSGAIPTQNQSVTVQWQDPVGRQEMANAVDAIIKSRQRRARYFDPGLFADPAWDILLSLYQAELAQRRTCTTNLCADANVPATTALRWIKSMSDDGILIRRPDPLDARRVFVELSPKASESMSRFIADWPIDGPAD